MCKVGFLCVRFHAWVLVRVSMIEKMNFLVDPACRITEFPLWIYIRACFWWDSLKRCVFLLPAAATGAHMQVSAFLLINPNCLLDLFQISFGDVAKPPCRCWPYPCVEQSHVHAHHVHCPSCARKRCSLSNVSMCGTITCTQKAWWKRIQRDAIVQCFRHRQRRQTEQAQMGRTRGKNHGQQVDNQGKRMDFETLEMITGIVVMMIATCIHYHHSVTLDAFRQ